MNFPILFHMREISRFISFFSFMEDQDAKLPLKSCLNYNETQMTITTSVIE